MKASIFAVVVLAFSSHAAFAVSMAVKLACRDDYFAHCSMHAPGGPGVRACMRNVGPRLSARCLGALADAGMIKGSHAAGKTTLAKAKATRPHNARGPATKKAYAQKRAKKTYAAKASARKYAAKPQKVQKAQKQMAAKPSAKKARYAKAQLKKQYAARD